MNYSNNALQDLEHDISYWCSRYYVPGYEVEDLEQECRMSLWKAFPKFNTDKGVYVRTWANHVIKNRLRELLRNSYYDCRSVGHKLVHEIDIYIPVATEILDLDAVLAEYNENREKDGLKPVDLEGLIKDWNEVRTENGQKPLTLSDFRQI